MNSESYFHNCSEDYIASISPDLPNQLVAALESLTKRPTQAELNADLWWILVSQRWSYDSLPQGIPAKPQADLGIRDVDRESLLQENQRALCRTSTTLGALWRSDFAQVFDGRLVHVEAQFGRVESMFKDFCGFRIAYYERRLALGVEVVISKPLELFAHRKRAISSMAYFDIAKKTLPALGLECPIWLLGLSE